jgi:2-(1,2-epoxy-1,2-dihydrophenyl)acetyl-CoA isomerase
MADETETPVLDRIESGVGRITLNRPSQLNAFNLQLAEQFQSVLDSYAEDETVRAIVINGAGRVFSAGGDVKEMLRNVTAGTDRAAYFHAPLGAFHKLARTVRAIPKPVLASVHGYAAGFAFNLMLSCDLVIAGEGTRFAQAFVNVGLSPDGGGTYILPRLVGHARACELVMLPAELDARKALEWGLVNWVVPVDDLAGETDRIARQLASGPTRAIGRAKLLLNSEFGRPFSVQMEEERNAQVENAQGRDFEEGLRAFSEKRKPMFTGG